MKTRSIVVTDSLIARFWAKVDKNGPVHPKLGTRCWLWTGGKNRRGYGSITAGGKEALLPTDRRSATLIATRVAYTISFGPLPDGLFACHHCDTPECVRPDHLFAGTEVQNAADMDSKGRRRGRPRPPHCPRGHEYSEVNLVLREGAGVHCRICELDRSRRREYHQGPEYFADYRASNRTEIRRKAREKYWADKGLPVPDVKRRNPSQAEKVA